MKRFLGFAAPVLASLALAAPGAGQPVMQPQFRVNDAVPGTGPRYNFANGVDLSKDGTFVVAWSNSYSVTIPYDVFGRRYGVQSAPLGGRFRVNATSPGEQYEPSVARDSSGRSVFVWCDAGTAIWGRRFAADGTALGGDFLVNTSTPLQATGPRVASDPSGNFVVTWTSSTPGADQAMARRFASSGAPLGDEFPVGQSAQDVQVASGIAMAPSGFVVTWFGEGASGNGVFGRRFDSSGEPMTGDLQMNTGTLPSVSSGPDVAMNAEGGFVAVWGVENAQVEGRRYDSTGSPLDGVMPITGGAQPRVASDSAGNFLVVWSQDFSIAGRSFDAGGDPVGAEFRVDETSFSPGGPLPSLADDGSFVVAWTNYSYFNSDPPQYSWNEFDVYGRKSGMRAAQWIDMDPAAGASSATVGGAGNGVLEPGETISIHTAWVNDTSAGVELSGTAPFFTGPAGADYTINDGSAYYGTIPAGYATTCLNGANCYSVTVSAPAVRPVQHWDARLQENLSIGVPKSWMLHIGESFADVPTGNPFYAPVETLFHNGVTGGCGGAGYCPERPVSRGQMAVFLLKSKFGAAHVPPTCTGAVFTDVSCSSPFDPWIEELAALGITEGCSDSLYCPDDSVTRQQMAVFLLKTPNGSAYTPPACTQQFEDVPCTGQFADWIGDLAGRGITGGCSASPALYCPTGTVNRGQMAAFLTRTFGLALYGG